MVRSLAIIALGVVSSGLGGCTSAPTRSIAGPVPYAHAEFEPLAQTDGRSETREFRAADHPMLERWRRHTLQQMLPRPLGWAAAGGMLRLASDTLERAMRAGWLDAPAVMMPPIQADLSVPRPAPITFLAIGSPGTESLRIRPPTGRVLATDKLRLPRLRAAPPSIPASSPRSRRPWIRIAGEHIELGMQVVGLMFLAFVVLTPALCSCWASRTGSHDDAARRAIPGPAERGDTGGSFRGTTVTVN